MDVKPSNLMLAEDGRLKIVDFGLAQTTRDPEDLDKSIVGTPLYIAPEQIVGGSSDLRMDIYSLGVTFFEMLYGRLPFSGQTVPDIFYTKLHGVMPQRSEVNGSVPSTIYDVVARMLERDPEKRIRNYTELIEELESARRNFAQLQVRKVETQKLDAPNVLLSGFVYDRPLPEIFGQIAQEQWSGRLSISWGQIRKQLHFKSGLLVAVLSNQEGEDFIELVISRLPSDIKSMRRLQSHQSTDLYQGYTTVLQRITPELRATLSDDLHAHARKILQNLFSWMMGEYLFESGEFPPELNLKMNMHDVVDGGVRKWLDYTFIRRKLLDGSCKLVHDQEFIRKLRPLNLAPSDRFLLFRFDREILYQDLYKVSGIAEEEFARLIYLFYCFGLIHLQKDDRI
jgi:hypothetical protein